MKLFITGVAGHIGSNLAIYATERGLPVIGVDSFTDYYSPHLKRHTAEYLRNLGVDVREIDLTNPKLADHLSDCEAIIHLAAQPGISNKVPWEEYHRNNIIATHELLESAKGNAHLKIFVNIATSSCYGLEATVSEDTAPKPASWYGATKLAAEQEALSLQRSFGFPACSLRLFSVFGERERPDKLFPKLLRAISNDDEFTLFEGSLEHHRSFTYVRDICEGILMVIDKYRSTIGEVFNLGTNQSFTTENAIKTVESIIGSKVKIKTVPKRPGDQKATTAVIDKIRDKIGWRPTTELYDGLSSMVKWYHDDIHRKLDWV